MIAPWVDIRVSPVYGPMADDWPESVPPGRYERTPVNGTARSEVPGRGTWQALADGMDAYHAVNLREALRLIPDTGDWHGSLRHACEIAIRDTGQRPPSPNQTAEQMRAQPRFGDVKPR